MSFYKSSLLEQGEYKKPNRMIQIPDIEFEVSKSYLQNNLLREEMENIK